MPKRFPRRFSRFPHWTCMAMLGSLLLSGCGQTGPLYLPQRPAPPVPAEAAMPATPADEAPAPAPSTP